MTRSTGLAVWCLLSVAGATPAAEQELTLPPLPQAKSSLGAAILDGWLYVYGGHTGKTHTYSTEDVTGRFHRLKLNGGTEWEQLPGGPAIQGLALVAHKGKLYRIGGMEPRNRPGLKADSFSLASCDCFDPVTKKWEAIANLPEGRSSHDAVVLGDQLYVLGGWKLDGAAGQRKWHSTALVLDLSKKPLKWEALEQPFQRRALTVAAQQDRIFVIGGLTPEREERGGVSIFDTKTRKWSNGPELPGGTRHGAFSPASCVAGGRLYLSPADGKLHRLKEKGDGWEEMSVKLKQGRTVHRVLPLSDTRLVVVGGASRGGNVQLMEVVDLSKDHRSSAITPDAPKSR